MENRRYQLETSWQALLSDLSISVQDVLRHANLPLDLMTRRSPTINADEYFRLWNGLSYLLQDDPVFPLRLAQTIKPESFGPPIFACFCSENLNMALERIAKYKPLVGPCRLEVGQNNRHTVVAFEGLPETEPPPTSLIIFELVFWVQVARLATRENIIPVAIHTTIDIPGRDAYEKYFGVEIQSGDVNAITFSAEDARKRFLTASAAMWSIFEPELRKRMDDLTRDSSFTERVRACLTEILASGHYSMSDVASKLAVSTRTLQRRLQAEDTSFQKELDSLREQLARHYLSNSEYSSGQIAFLLGYEEPNSFFRAFRNWTGQTPEVVRASLQ